MTISKKTQELSYQPNTFHTDRSMVQWSMCGFRSFYTERLIVELIL